jgi:hypothetical protein
MKYYLVNTNRTADPSAQDELTMLKEQIVALYFDGYKECIDTLTEGDVVFLYSNKKGVIACGNVHGKTQKRSYKGLAKFKNEEFYKSLENFKAPNEPITLSHMKELFGKSPMVKRAFRQLDDDQGKALFDAIKLTSGKLLKAA